MQQQLQQIDGRPKADAQRVRAVVETLTGLRSTAETVAEVAHDARNMVTALGLYCDLLEEPGVLAPPYAHYGSELRLVASASRRLVEKLVALEVSREGVFREGETADGISAGVSALLPAGMLSANGGQPAAFASAGQAALPGWGAPPHVSSPVSSTGSSPASSHPSSSLSSSPMANSISTSVSGPAAGHSPASLPGSPSAPRSSAAALRDWELTPAVPVKNLAAELMANRNLLSALAGPSIILTAAVDGGAQPVRLTGEDLTRVLINLVKNACEAMPGGGRIRIALAEQFGASGHTLLLTVEDTGPGIREEYLDSIFLSGFSAPAAGPAAPMPAASMPAASGPALSARAKSNWPATHRGLGLAITRSIIEGSGGRISASNCNPRGARFTIELPVVRP